MVCNQRACDPGREVFAGVIEHSDAHFDSRHKSLISVSLAGVHEIAPSPCVDNRYCRPL